MAESWPMSWPSSSLKLFPVSMRASHAAGSLGFQASKRSGVTGSTLGTAREAFDRLARAEERLASSLAIRTSTAAD